MKPPPPRSVENILKPPFSVKWRFINHGYPVPAKNFKHGYAVPAKKITITRVPRTRKKVKNNDMKTIVKNVLTNDKMVFVNDLPLVDNMVNAIICIEKKTDNLLNEKVRKKIIAENNLVEHTSKISGKTFVYCEKYDLIAHTEK